MQSTSQAIADARKAADYMNATAPDSPAARQATQAYQETVRQGTMAKTTHDTNIAYNVTRTAQVSVNRVNNVATGRLPNTSRHMTAKAIPTAISIATARKVGLPPPMPQGGGSERRRAVLQCGKGKRYNSHNYR